MQIPLFFIASVFLLAVLLFFPVSKLIWVMSVRRMQKKLGRELSDAEIQGQLRRARFIAVVVVFAFSYFFNRQVLG